ncbi:hypothetical protein CLV67_102703 [Actinoplanes italicus]|uniref:Uncharacterized protein n=1 Tax=Actinoplanes italicus TaxID=113567 RepID=A0A2T0KMS3_9ACTN|nr:hypothetical protein CLV67_102703 [Actinoplanes italicus]
MPVVSSRWAGVCTVGGSRPAILWGCAVGPAGTSQGLPVARRAPVEGVVDRRSLWSCAVGLARTPQDSPEGGRQPKGGRQRPISREAQASAQDPIRSVNECTRSCAAKRRSRPVEARATAAPVPPGHRAAGPSRRRATAPPGHRAPGQRPRAPRRPASARGPASCRVGERGANATPSANQLAALAPTRGPASVARPNPAPRRPIRRRAAVSNGAGTPYTMWPSPGRTPSPSQLW